MGEFKIIDGVFENNCYGNEDYLENWPMLYILENGKQAYIGESNHVKTRMMQHAKDDEKRKIKFENEEKYPVEKAKGNAAKYDQLT